MKLLYILRHGKASGTLPGGRDRDRPLVEKGIRASERVAAECARRGWHPATALVSPALRAQMTFEFFDRSFRAAGGRPIATIIDPALYLAEPEQLRDSLAALEAHVPSALLVGHNPGLHELAFDLAGGRSGDAFKGLSSAFPTATLAAFRCDVDDWADIGGHNTQFAGAILARDIDQS